MNSSSSCGSRGSSLRRRSERPSHPRRRERRRSRPTLIPCTNAEALCMGRQKLFLTCEPATSTASSAPVRMWSRCTNWPRRRSAASVNTRSTFWAWPRAKYTICEASFTMLEILGCVSSSRICTRVRIGPIRDCTSLTRRFTLSEVRRIWKSSTVRITTCTTRASAATMLKISSHTCIAAPLAPLGVQTRLWPATSSLRLLRLAQVRFAPCFDRCRDRILLAYRHFFSAFDQFIGSLTQFACLALRIVLAFVRFLRKIIARLVAGFRRKKNAHEGANAKTHKKVRHLGTHTVRHNNLQSQASTARVKLQSFLTGISQPRRLLLVRILEDSKNPFRAFSRHNLA